MKSKSRQRDKYLQRTYGITLHRYNQMLREQNDACAICERHKSEFSKSLAVDHDHASGRVRSLLCFTCNKFRVGRLTLYWAEKVFAYLKKHSSDPA